MQSWHKTGWPHIAKMFIKILISVGDNFKIQIRICLRSLSIITFKKNFDWILCTFWKSLKCMNNKDKKNFLRTIITINAPLILKMRDIIFFLQANYIMGHFKGYFEGAKTFLTPKLSRAQRGTILESKKSRPPRNIPRNGPLCSLPKTQKNNIPNFQNQRCIGIFMSLGQFDY